MPGQNHRHCEAKATYVAAAALFVSKEETRYYLNGICIEPHPKKGVLVVATDGHYMAVLHDEDGTTNGRWICPVPKEVATASKGDRRVRFDGDRAMVLKDDARLIDCEAPAIDGMFPDWRKVMRHPLPAGSKNLGLALNSKLLASFTKASTILGSSPKFAGLSFAAASLADPVIVRIMAHPEFAGLVMPIRHLHEPLKAAADHIPDWMPGADPAEREPTPAETGVMA